MISFRNQFDKKSPLDESVREGARRMLQSAIDADLEALAAQHEDRRTGLGGEPRRVLDELSEIRLMDVVLATRSGIIRRCCVSRPTEHQQILLDHLSLRLPTRIIKTDM